MYKIVLLFSVLTFNLAYSQTLKGDRILAWEVGEAQGETYDSAFNLATDMCMETVHISMVWSALDTNNGSFNHNFISNVLDISNIYYPAYGMKADIQLAPINTNVAELPKDLAGMAMNNLTVINRFKQTLDTFFAHIPNLEPRRLTFSFSRNGNLASINPQVDNEVLVKKTDYSYVRIGDFTNVKITSVDYFDLFGEVVK